MSLLPRYVYELVDRSWRTDAQWPGEPELRWVTVLRVHCYEECFRSPRRGLCRALYEACLRLTWAPARQQAIH